jgi:hypothetical protein
MRRTLRGFGIVLDQTGSKSGSNLPPAADERGKPQVDRWGGQDFNLRPTDYENDPGESSDQVKPSQLRFDLG